MEIDWPRLFTPSIPPLEIVLRGTIMYLALFGLLRFVTRREAGALGLTDMLVIVLLADAAQNGMSGGYQSITDGLVLVATIIAWSYGLTWLAYHSAFWRRIVHPPRVKLVSDGRILRSKLEQELITDDELMGELRNHGVDDLRRVKAAYMESDGMISVITSKGDANAPNDRKRRAGGG
jgi:uncharacterized membrane protein YcaP (DUF421 family)